MANEFYTVKELADLLKLKKLAVYRMIENGEIPHYRVGKGQRIRIRKEDVETYLQQQKVIGKPEG